MNWLRANGRFLVVALLAVLMLALMAGGVLAQTSVDEDGIPLPQVATGLETLAQAGAIRLIGFMLGVSLAFYIYRRIRMR